MSRGVTRRARHAGIASKAIVQEWKPWQPTAVAALQPWKQLSPARDWAALTERCITPALEGAMLELLSLNPTNPDTRPLDWLAPWRELLPPSQLAGILDRAFFPEVHRVLHVWLTHSGAIFDEVWAWLEATKSVHVPPAAAADPRIATHLSIAVTAIHNAQSGLPLPTNYPLVSSAPTGAGAPVDAPAAANAAAMAEIERELERKSIKEFVAEAAAAAGLAWVPRAGRLVAGLQVYAMGKLSVVVDIHAGVVKAFLGDRWVPMGIDEVVQEALKKES